jgi:UDP-N-acetylmuramate dehydrogenase
MEIRERVPLAELTTFKLGGEARYVATCQSIEDIETALAFARERGLPWYVIGGGSNILAGDHGYEGVIIQPLLEELIFGVENERGENKNQTANSTADACVITAGAGVVWDTLVQESVTRGLWGLENLAGIPGLVGGAPVQNIGAYGADVSQTITFVDAFDTKAQTVVRFSKDECAFAYRDSRFKQDSSYIILRVGFLLSTNNTPHINYADLSARAEAGTALDTPAQITETVRSIRAKKFPDLRVTGTAGSFFKNPTITKAAYEKLLETYPELPGFPTATEEIKIPLAWVLDHILHLRGYAKGHVRLFEQQPLVLAAEAGATTKEVEALAREVEQAVKDSTGISVEREVRKL